MFVGVSGLYASRICLGMRSSISPLVAPLLVRGTDTGSGILAADSFTVGTGAMGVGGTGGGSGVGGKGCGAIGAGVGSGFGNLDGLGCLARFSSCTHSHSSPLACISQNQPAPGLFGKSTGATVRPGSP